MTFTNLSPLKTLRLLCPSRRTARAVFALSLALFLTLLSGRLQASPGQTFGSPDDAVKALVAASASPDTTALRAIFGPEGHDLVSPDAVQATAEFKIFVQRLSEKVRLISGSDSKVTLELGADAWPFPIPLVKQDGRWFFDTAAGRAEILNRRVGMNELGAIDVCRAYVEAQRDYASQDRLGDGVLAYAQLLHSTAGQHDGLFWPAEPGEGLSPLGPLVAAARGEGYERPAKMLNDEQAPYHGYYFKILTRQGEHATGGRHDYLINGRMIAGFALVAWPAAWGNTGVMTFIVNQQGKVYQCNLGSETAKLAAAMNEFDPDVQWVLVP
jgi:Protein of unknown function (DUF2950)